MRITELRKPNIIFEGKDWNNKSALTEIILTDIFVYGWKRDNEFLYIGKTESGRIRFSSFCWGHRIINKKEKVRSTDNFYLWICSSGMEVNKLERDLIQLFKPIYNKQYVTNQIDNSIKKESKPYIYINYDKIIVPDELLMKCKSKKELKEIKKKILEDTL